MNPEDLLEALIAMQIRDTTLTPEQLHEAWRSFQFAGLQHLTDEQFYEILVRTVFYSGFRAATVMARLAILREQFPSPTVVAGYGPEHVAAILADPRMIRNRRKVICCVQIAQKMVATIQQHGSFHAYLASFQVDQSFGGLLRLHEDLCVRMKGIGKATAFHFMMDVGLPVLKPDSVVCRVFTRLGIIPSEDHQMAAVLAGRGHAVDMGEPIRFFDSLLVAFGQESFPEFGIEQGICLTNPRCEVCTLHEHCHYYAEHHPA
jgi:DNA-3-methyladenine glycosylase I